MNNKANNNLGKKPDKDPKYANLVSLVSSKSDKLLPIYETQYSDNQIFFRMTLTFMMIYVFFFINAIYNKIY